MSQLLASCTFFSRMVWGDNSSPHQRSQAEILNWAIQYHCRDERIDGLQYSEQALIVLYDLSDVVPGPRPPHDFVQFLQCCKQFSFGLAVRCTTCLQYFQPGKIIAPYYPSRLWTQADRPRFRFFCKPGNRSGQCRRDALLPLWVMYDPIRYQQPLIQPSPLVHSLPH